MLDFLKFYNRPQSYRAKIEIKVKNNGSAPAQCTAVIPLPLSADYQTVTPVFSERTMQKELTLQSKEEQIVSVEFSAQVLPRKYTEKIPSEIIQANEFVINYLTYGNAIDGLYTAQEAREKRVVDCGGFDSLMQDELKKKGIESKIVAGFWSTGAMHAWLEIHQGLTLMCADPSVEYLRRHGRTKKSGRLGFVGSDRITISSEGEFLQKPFLRDETPQLYYETNFYCTRA